MPIIEVELKGVEEIAKKLNDPKIREPIKEMLTEAVKVGQSAAVKAISGGTGLAERSIGRTVWSRTLKGRVYTRIKYERAMSIEEGRLPGEPPSLMAVAMWMKGIPYRRDLILTKEESSLAFKIQEAIRLHGARGKGYLKAAEEAIEKELPRLKRTAMDRIINLLSR